MRLLLHRTAARAASTAASSSAATHYEVLGIRRTASKAEIKQAYLRLSKMHHPDMNIQRSRGAQNRAAQQFVKVNTAFEVLSDTAKRFDYDANLFRGGSGGSSGSYSSGWGDASQYARRYGQYTHQQEFREGFDAHFFHHGVKASRSQKVVSTTVLFAGLATITLIGMVYHYVVINYTKSQVDHYLELRSAMAASNLAAVRDRATRIGYDKQMDMLQQTQPTPKE